MFARDAQPQTPVTAPTDRCSFHQRETRLEDPKPPRLRGFPGARSQLVLVGLLVAHRGFEPLISALRGRCPRPLDECALPITIAEEFTTRGLRGSNCRRIGD